jgi:hypothetical protein
VLLADPGTGHPLALLTSPFPNRIFGLDFAPGAGRFAVAAEQPALQVWDLRRLRADLAALGLDADLPPAPPPEGEVKPVRVEVVGEGEKGS